MIEEYTKTVDNLNLQENLKSNDDNHVSEELILMKSCVDMYDQEFMVKVKRRNKPLWIISHLIIGEHKIHY